MKNTLFALATLLFSACAPVLNDAHTALAELGGGLDAVCPADRVAPGCDVAREEYTAAFGALSLATTLWETGVDAVAQIQSVIAHAKLGLNALVDLFKKGPVTSEQVRAERAALAPTISIPLKEVAP